MKVLRDIFKIATMATRSDGQKLEPEEKPVQHRLEGTVTVQGQLTGKPLGQMQGAIIAETTTVGLLAKGIKTSCHLCRHFDHAAAQKLIGAKMESLSPEALSELNEIRFYLLSTQNARLRDMHNNPQEGDGEMDVEHAMKMLGICRPLTEIHKEIILVHPLGRCPDEVKSATSPDGFFESKGHEERKVGDADYDQIMGKATGKIV